jgi:hypothetical protein
VSCVRSSAHELRFIGLAADLRRSVVVCCGRAQREVREHAFYQPLDFVKLISRQLPTPHVPKVSSPSDISNYDKFDEPDLQQWDDHNTDDAKTFGFWEEEKKGLKS